MDAKIEGGESKIDAAAIGERANVASSADAILNQSAFDQNITQGANIQFNSITIQAAVRLSTTMTTSASFCVRPARHQPRGSFFKHFISVAAVAARTAGRPTALTVAATGEVPMASASFVEIISHFAGYLQIFHDIARDRIHYDDSLAPRPSGDYTTPRPNYDHRFVPDDMDTVGGPGAGTDTGRSDAFAPGRPLKLLPVRRTPISISSRVRRRRTCRCRNRRAAAVAEAVSRSRQVKYQDGGEETQLTVHQYNFMHDDDINLSPEALAVVEPLITTPQ